MINFFRCKSQPQPQPQPQPEPHKNKELCCPVPDSPSICATVEHECFTASRSDDAIKLYIAAVAFAEEQVATLRETQRLAKERELAILAVVCKPNGICN
jgi:hypothetical protein